MSIVPTKTLTDSYFGPMLVFADDIGCSKMLQEYGEYSKLELAVIESFLSPDSIVLDIGAHIGALTIPISKMCKKVYAFEPQEDVRELLKWNLDHHNRTNVEIFPFALGFDNSQKFYTPNPYSMGSIRMEDTGDRSVQVVSLDDLGLSPTFIKIDVEGMEVPVVAGGQKTIMQHRPHILAERTPGNNDLLHGLSVMNYCSCLMDLPVYTPNNFKHNPTNHYPKMAHQMILGMPN